MYTKSLFFSLTLIAVQIYSMQSEEYPLQVLINVANGPISTILLQNYELLQKECQTFPVTAEEVQRIAAAYPTLLQPQFLLDYADLYYKRKTTQINGDDLGIAHLLQQHNPKTYYAYCAGIFNSLSCQKDAYGWQKQFVIHNKNQAEPFLSWFHTYVERDRYVQKERADRNEIKWKVVTFIASIELVALATIALTLYVHAGCE